MSGKLCACVAAAGLAAAALRGGATDFGVLSATYLGGPCPREEWNAVDVAPDGTIVAGGTMPEGGAGGRPPIELMGGGDGVVVRLGGGGTNVLSVTRLGDSVADLDVGEDGRIALTGSFGVGVLSPGGTNLVWRDGSVLRGTRAAAFRNLTPPFKHDRYIKPVARVAVGRDGTVASIQAEEKVHAGPKKGRLYVWDRDGKRLCEAALQDCKYPEDVCVSASNRLVIVGGFNTYAADSVHMKNHPIHMPWLAAFDYEGRRKWERYNFTAQATYAQNTFADSRVQRLAIGRDGLLYMGGYIHGGDYVWRHDPQDVKKRVSGEGGYDAWSRAANMGRGMDMSYFARFDPATGDFLRGQPLLCRQNADGSGKPAQIQIRGIHADTAGNVYLAGYCERYTKGRDACTVNGAAVAPYDKPEAFLMTVASDFGRRTAWTVFSAKCESAAWGVSVRGGTAALAAEVYDGAMLVTSNALQRAAAQPTDGYLVVWKP